MTTTQHLIDFANVDAPELEARNEAARIADLEISERIGRELEAELSA